jgi:hypothetical protein
VRQSDVRTPAVCAIASASTFRLLSSLTLAEAKHFRICFKTKLLFPRGWFLSGSIAQAFPQLSSRESKK